MNTSLPPFPVDDATLDLIDHALDPNPTGRTSVSSLLDMLSGYDEAKRIAIAEGVSEYPEPTYSHHDLIRALVDEVRRLRKGADT